MILLEQERIETLGTELSSMIFSKEIESSSEYRHYDRDKEEDVLSLLLIDQILKKFNLPFLTFCGS